MQNMIPFLLAAVGGYLIGQSRKDEQFADGGRIKSYEKVDGTDYELKIEIYYNKGGMNYFSGKPEERGYYLSVSPVQIERRPNGITTESYTAFSGIKALILRVNRQSPKAEKEAEILAQERIPELKNYVLGKMKERGIIMADGGMMARGGNVRSLLKNFNEEKPSILLIMIADDVTSEFMKKKFDRTIKWSDLTDAEKQKYNEDFRVNKSKFDTYLMYEFVKLYYSDKKIKEKCKGSSRKTIDAIKSVMTDLAKKYDESKYADGGMMSRGGKVKKKWIQDALSGDKGKLRQTAKRKGLLRGDENLSMTDLKKLQKMGGKTAKRAHLAETLRKFDDGGEIKHYVEKVYWYDEGFDGDNDGYIYGINYVDFENEGDIIDVEWFKTKEEREKAISELENVTIIQK